MSRLLYRSEAAKMLGTTAQTVTNWIKKGVLRGHAVGRSTMVDGVTIGRYFDDLKDIAATGDRVRQLKKEVLFAETSLSSRLSDLRSALSADCDIPRNILQAAFFAVLSLTSADPRQQQVIHLLFSGYQVSSISAALGITRTDVITSLSGAIRQVRLMYDYQTLFEAYNKLRDECDEHKATIAVLRSVIEKHSFDKKASDRFLGPDGGELTSLLRTRLNEFVGSLSVRCLNCLKGDDIETVADVVSHDHDYFIKLRNFGRQCQRELDSFIRGLGLDYSLNVTDLLYADSVKINSNTKEL